MKYEYDKVVCTQVGDTKVECSYPELNLKQIMKKSRIVKEQIIAIKNYVVADFSAYCIFQVHVQKGS